jgi:membrane-associated phospholipid phosphatase
MDHQSRWVAEFWSDDNAELTFTPAARFLAIAVQLLEQKRFNLAETVEMYAKLGMALSDCGVGIWNSKFFYNLERPVTPINRILNQNWKTICYNPLQGYVGKSPNFPAYPSGHAGFGAAGGKILADYFGMNYAFTDRCHEGRTEFLGEPRSFNGFRQMWEENAYSRIPLGVHYRMDCDAGIEMGIRSADGILSLPWK